MDAEKNVAFHCLLVSLLQCTELDVVVDVSLIPDAEHLCWQPLSLS